MRFLIAIFLTSVAQGQLLPGIDPRLPQAKPTETLPPVRVSDEATTGTGAVLCQRLEGIRLESITAGELRELASGLSVSGQLIVPSPVTLAAKLSKWHGKPLTSGDLLSIADTLLIHYDVEGYPVVNVEAPQQDFKDGILRLTLEIGKIGNVGVTRPKYGNPKSITRGLTLHRGEILRRADVDEQTAWLDRSIFRNVQLLVSPGSEPATADLLFALAEKKPWRVTLGYDNSSPELLGRDRFTVGMAGMLPNEQVIAWQTVLGIPATLLQANALSWEIPFQRLHQTLQFDGVYAEVQSRSINNGLPVENTGTSWSVAATQKFTLPSLGKWRQNFAVGPELKSTNQFVLFGGTQFSPGEVKLVDVKIIYGIGRDWKNGALLLDSTLLGSPGGFVSGNHDSDFHVYDPQADSTYVVARLNADSWWSPGGDWRIAVRGSAQLTDSRLLPVEQFAAGGYQTVRGIPEREFYADDGWQSSLELYSPALTIKKLYQMRLLIFYDQAVIKNRGESSEFLSGYGIGARVKVTEHLNFRIDQGWRLDDKGSQTHIGLQIGF